MAKKDSRIILITGDLGFGVLDDFANKLPNQYVNAGVTEQSMMSVAAGLASQGFRPFVYSIANFSTLR
jgi:transketolase